MCALALQFFWTPDAYHYGTQMHMFCVTEINVEKYPDDRKIAIVKLAFYLLLYS
jgi:hypothetical protein